ncbi:MAG: hypothetical protein HRT53_21390 [Colwellia sp.]|nr:hypothetical protein [Colwellia sp.]
MELDDLKNAINLENKTELNINSQSLKTIKTKVSNFEKETKRNILIESLVAAIAFIFVITAILNGHSIYPIIIASLLPDLAQTAEPKINFMMYASLITMAIYCLFIPIKLYSTINNDESLNWTLTSRVDNEIEKLTNQKKLWSQAHLWSFIPAAFIGILFFWGLQISLLNTWIPNIYLSIYLVFITLAFTGGIWMKKYMSDKRIQPLLDNLHNLKKQLNSTAV